MADIPKDWYERALTVDVKKDIASNERIKSISKPYYKSFVRFAARQRINYVNDIEAEWSEYYEKYIKNRLSDVDIDSWKRLCHQVFERDHYTCFYCGQTGGILEVDHMTPVSRGGESTLDNLVTACRHCNRQKRDKTVAEYLKWKDEHA
ncbi:HNH endonuclease [Lactiplantibacillus plantarum]|uniref:HNH endonuclease n=1 Tax=Lactiplantibacillus plantarum TaxID=1590 RepID=UPI0014561FDC|nr:HNH endonuclease [Lactiplantibacillus plantarum]MCG0748025.1 HNH endonuclease [Lactiplantibacillus plantarum]NLS61468.1 hypothetical protein [Lactiplantibacillus plantarum]